MTQAKKPQDHKAKSVAKDVDGGKQVTVRGVTVVVSADAANDYELLELLSSGEGGSLPEALRRLFGVEQLGVIKEAIRNPETGIVAIQGEGSLAEFMTEVFGAINPNG